MKWQSLTENTIARGEEVLANDIRGILAYLPFLGPAIIASIAYMDPGNFATNIQAGAQFGYLLLWVVLVANVIAMLFQSLSAKIGIVTGKSLAEQCRDHFPKPLVYIMWIASEIAAMATDLAEILGGAIGVSLIFHLPLIVGCIIAGIVTYGILLLQGYGFRPMEAVISAFVGAIGLSYVAELFLSSPSWGAALQHMALPQLAGSQSVLLAVGIVGATVMPHAIYLHSSLTKDRIPVRDDADRARVLRFSNHEVLAALGVAGLVNIAMVMMSAAVFHFNGHQEVASIETAYQTLTPLLGAGASIIFLISLLASGFSSSVVGTMAGQTIMQDFVRFNVPLWLRRVLTLAPTFIIVALGINPTEALVVSQVVLSLIVPIPLAALIYLTGKRSVMGVFQNSALTNVAAITAGALVLSLNILLLLLLAHVPLPFFTA